MDAIKVGVYEYVTGWLHNETFILPYVLVDELEAYQADSLDPKKQLQLFINTITHKFH